jgi:hypothetical protein
MKNSNVKKAQDRQLGLKRNPQLNLKKHKRFSKTQMIVKMIKDSWLNLTEVESHSL